MTTNIAPSGPTPGHPPEHPVQLEHKLSPTPEHRSVPNEVPLYPAQRREPQIEEAQAAEDSMPVHSTPTASVLRPSLLPVEPDVWGSLTRLNSSSSRFLFKESQTRYVIGRGPQRADSPIDVLVRDLPKMSRIQCTIEWQVDGKGDITITLTDLGSHNGTWLKGDKIEKGQYKILCDHDIVAIGLPFDPEARSTAGSSARQPDTNFLFKTHNLTNLRTPERRVFAKTYDLQQKLGQGGFGIVWKALHIEEGKWYAVKLLDKKDISAASRREVQLLRDLQHPNIVQFKEAVDETSKFGLIMELMHGGDLKAYLDRSGKLTEAMAQYFTYQICDALAYLHAMGVAHRDLKPSNIMLDRSEPPILKLVDFGLAKMMNSQTLHRTYCGTPMYRAPEVVNNDSNVYNALVDSWSLGVTLSMMLWRRSPFTEESDRSFSIDRSLLLSCDVSASGREFLCGLLKYNPDERMSPSVAKDHPWLQAEAAKHNTAPPSSPRPLPRVHQAHQGSASATLRTQPSPPESPLRDRSNEHARATQGTSGPSCGAKRTAENDGSSSKSPSRRPAPKRVKVRDDVDEDTMRAPAMVGPSTGPTIDGQ